jgi:hypothetical protein
MGGGIDMGSGRLIVMGSSFTNNYATEGETSMATSLVCLGRQGAAELTGPYDSCVTGY